MLGLKVVSHLVYRLQLSQGAAAQLDMTRPLPTKDGPNPGRGGWRGEVEGSGHGNGEPVGVAACIRVQLKS